MCRCTHTRHIHSYKLNIVQFSFILFRTFAFGRQCRTLSSSLTRSNIKGLRIRRALHRTPRTPECMPTDRAIVHTPTPVRVFLVHTACGITQCWAFDKPSSMLWSVGVAPTSLMLINAAGTLQRRSAAHRTGKSLPLRRSASCRRCSTRPSALYPLRTR